MKQRHKAYKRGRREEREGDRTSTADRQTDRETERLM